jgi:hypothetical protein
VADTKLESAATTEESAATTAALPNILKDVADTKLESAATTEESAATTAALPNILKDVADTKLESAATTIESAATTAALPNILKHVAVVVTYSKSAGYLDTTGYAIAGLGTAWNGASAGFTFTAYGGTGKYQKIVYSCFVSGTTWVVDKVIDEGTNTFDIEASASASTMVFTFKARSGSQNYTPRVVIEATGHSIISTYA